jgi:PAS domain S-box-containing protein
MVINQLKHNLTLVFPWLVLLFSIVITSLSYSLEMTKDQQTMQAIFDKAVENITTRMQRHIQNNQQVLLGVGGFIDSNEDVSRREFNRYISRLDLAENYPGILALSFNPIVPKAEKDAHIAAVRESGIPGYAIQPEGDRDSYTPVLFIEPFTDINQQALGYDTYVDVVRRVAMMEASDSGNATLTGKIELQQQGAGALLFLPIYSQDTPVELLEEHPGKVLGWAVAVFHVKPMMDSILSSILGEYDLAIDVELYDGEMASAGTLLYDRDGTPHLGHNSSSEYQSIQHIKFGERVWTLRLNSLPPFEAYSQKATTIKLVVGSIIMGLLLTLLAFLLVNNRKRALLGAMKMTAELNQLVISEREQRALLSATLDTVADAIITIDEKGCIESFNLSAIKIFGYQPEEVIGNNVKILMPQPYQAEHDGYLSRFLQERTPHVIGMGREVVGLRKDGSKFPMELAVNETMLADRRIFTGVVRDISERKRIENELILSKQESEAIFDENIVRVIDALSRGDLTQKIILGNKQETDRHRAISENLNTMVDQLNRFSEEVTRVAREVGTEGTLGGQAEVPGVDGTWKELTDNVNAMANNLTTQVRNIADVTKAVAKGDLSQKITVDAQGEVLELKNTVNEMVDQLNRFSVEVTRVAREVGTEGTLGGQAEVPGVDGTWKELTDNVNAMANNLTTQVRNIADVTTAVAKGDLSQKITVDAQGEVFELKGNINAMISTLATDREQREHAKSALVLAMTDAEAANLTKSEFLANMSHEIRTPMNAIIGMSRLCLQTDMNDKQHKYIAKVNQSARGLLGVINDILDFSKIDAGMLVLEEVHFALESSLALLDSNVGYLARDKGLYFKTEVDPKVPLFLVGDPLRLGQVLLNLVSNAVKFTPEGGVKVLVSLKETTSESVELEFRVIDTGIGLSQEQADGLFGAFTQVDTSTTRKFGGTGLGLAISKRLVELMGGRIWIESVLGAGSSFCFTARFERGDEKLIINYDASVLPSANMLMMLKGKRILVVEDNEFNQDLIEELLEQCGVIVRLCGNGQEALDLLVNERFDIVLMDVQMPVMDGFEATRRIRATPALASQCIIAMTANAMAEDRRRCLDAGMDDFETKPIDADHLYQTLVKWLPDGAEATEVSQVAEASEVTEAPETTEVAPIEATEATEASEASEVAPIDLTVLDKLLRNDSVKIAKFALKFLQTSRTALAEMQAAHDNDDLERLAGLCHKQKSAAASVGAWSSTELYKALEVASKAGDWQQTQTLLVQLQPLIDQIALQIEREMS